MVAIEKELLRLTKCPSRKRTEAAQAYLVRLAKALDKAEDTAWEKLSPEAQTWANAAITDLNTGAKIASFTATEAPEEPEEPKKASKKAPKVDEPEDEADEPDEEEPEGETEEEADDEEEEEDEPEEDEPEEKKAPTKKGKAAKAPPAKDKATKAAARKEPKEQAPRKKTGSDRARELMVLHAKWDFDEVSAALTKEGFKVPKSLEYLLTIARRVLKSAADLGKLSDYNP